MRVSNRLNLILKHYDHFSSPSAHLHICIWRQFKSACKVLYFILTESRLGSKLTVAMLRLRCLVQKFYPPRLRWFDACRIGN